VVYQCSCVEFLYILLQCVCTTTCEYFPGCDSLVSRLVDKLVLG
jgi:hypothetical protein